MSIHVLIGEEDAAFGRYMAERLQREPGLQVVDVVCGQEVIGRCRQNRVDVVLLDLLPTCGSYVGIDVSIEVHSLNQGIRTIFMSNLNDEEIVLHAMTYGKAVNCIAKMYCGDIPEAVRSAYAGRSSIHHSTAGVLVRKLTETNKEALAAQITERQITILKLLEKGYDKKQIAEKLHYTEQSISNEVYKVSTALKSQLPYLAAVRAKKLLTKELVSIVKKMDII
ncbi:response regulator transcription factor [Paenibacillus athensensis]|uniref:response regulator transcription factor n=1 Tax=Paenibacillus athensensis TaxID=1967502 RepID=UPI00142F9626|nr:response regulator transcription factor [Paenibacillus athensensis]MCD1257627.1 response regulator transcription factor [Paenibacillus athensensis]